MQKQINVGLAGYGMAGKIFHAPLLNAASGIHLHTILERSSDQSIVDYPEVLIKKDYGQLIQSPELDLIVIALPNQWHYSYAKQALIAGKHVVIDKPFCIHSHEAEELIELSRSKGLLLSVFQNRRLDGSFLTVKQILDNHIIGDLIEYEAHFDRYRPQIKKNAWRESGEKGSGILYDLGAHLIDQAYFLFGDPVDIAADVQIQRKGAKADDFFELLLQYPDFKVKLTAGMLVEKETPHFFLKGTEASYVKYGLDPQESRLKNGESPLSADFGVEEKSFWGRIFERESEHGKTLETLPGNYLSFYHNIAASIRGKETLLVKPEEALAGIKMIEKALH